MSDYIASTKYCLDCANQRLGWYEQSGEERYLEDCKNYLGVAQIYIRELFDSNGVE
jgi:hypothetical protein